MNVLIATAGVLPPEPVAAIVERLVDPRDVVRVVTVLEIPRSFLNEIRSEEWRPLTEGAPGWDQEEDAVIARYVEERGRRLTDPVVAALRTRDIHAEALHLEGEDKAAAIELAIKTSMRLNNRYPEDVNPHPLKWSDLIAFPRPAGENITDSRDLVENSEEETESSNGTSPVQ